jgi:hypothetical protein
VKFLEEKYDLARLLQNAKREIQLEIPGDAGRPAQGRGVDDRPALPLALLTVSEDCLGLRLVRQGLTGVALEDAHWRIQVNPRTLEIAWVGGRLGRISR